ncbi:MAG: hypothetical protein JWQ87_1870 [Candidatus Sulfotelmatobacter sp.]|nr:hypothetical protein [Candidatus Sulfotelmatobacter sp.]
MLNINRHSTAVHGVQLMPQQPKQNLEEIIRKVQALRTLTKTTGFFTTRSIGALLAHLTPDELVEVADSLELTPREMPHR